MTRERMTREQWLRWLQPADILMYSTGGLVGGWIKARTWSDFTHCELYIGNGKTAAARGPQDGKGGVQTYEFRDKDLVLVLRPNRPFDLAAMVAFHERCIGQKYDTWGLVRVFYLGGDGTDDRAYCSEHVARMCRTRNGGPGLINECADCDDAAPAQLPLSPAVDWHWPDASGTPRRGDSALL